MNLSEQNLFVEQLPDDIKRSLVLYTGALFDRFNESLRRGKVLSAQHRSHLNNIDIAFEASPQLEETITVYKGLDTEDIFSDKAFISTSLYRRAALEFSGQQCCLLQITVPPGSKILPLSGISRSPHEAEILLDRDGELKVTGEKIDRRRNNVKVLFVSYTGWQAVDLQKEKDIAKAEKKFDPILIQERVIEILRDEEDLDFIDDEIIIMTYHQLTQSDRVPPEEMIENIKLQLGVE